MAETLRTEAGMLATIPTGVANACSAQDLRDIVYSVLRAYVRYYTETTAPTHTAGATYWDGENLNLMMSIDGVIRQLGEEVQTPLARNNTASDIANGKIVYVSGATGNKPTLALASNADTTAFQTIGVVTADIARNANGYATTLGVVRDIDTSAWEEGTQLYLGTNGDFTATKPGVGSRVVLVGRVLYQHSSNGMIFVSISRGRTTIYPAGVWEARPMVSSASFSDLEHWYWTDQTFPVLTGQSNQTDWTVEAYRDTQSLQTFFRHDQVNQLHANVQMPHEWAGTAVYLHLHTIPMAAGSGDVYWEGSYYFGQVNAELPAAASWTSMSATQSLTAGDQYIQRIASIATVAAPTSPGHSDVLTFRLNRNGDSINDTYATSKDHGTAAANLCLLSYDIHYQRRIAGSELAFSGRPDFNQSHLLFDKAYAFGDDVYVVLVAKSANGNQVEFQLYDITAGATVDGTVATTSTDWTVLLLGPLTLGAGMREYKIQGRYTGTADEPVIGNALFIHR